jgi:hypothetical protein
MQTRPVASIDRGVSLNCALWMLAEEIRKLEARWVLLGGGVGYVHGSSATANMGGWVHLAGTRAAGRCGPLSCHRLRVGTRF